MRGEPRTGDTPRNPSLHLSKFSSSSFEFAICGFIPMLQQIKLHQPTHRCLENGTAALRIICCKAAMYTTPARRVNFQVRDQTREYRNKLNPKSSSRITFWKELCWKRNVAASEARNKKKRQLGLPAPLAGRNVRRSGREGRDIDTESQDN